VVHREYGEEVIEIRSIDSGQKVLQILMNAYEGKSGESRE